MPPQRTTTHSILLILNPTLPRGPQDSPGQPPEASKRRSGRRSRQLTLSRRHARRSSLGFVVKAEHKKISHLERADRAVLESAIELACLQTFSGTDTDRCTLPTSYLIVSYYLSDSSFVAPVTT